MLVLGICLIILDFVVFIFVMGIVFNSWAIVDVFFLVFGKVLSCWLLWFMGIIGLFIIKFWLNKFGVFWVFCCWVNCKSWMEGDICRVCFWIRYWLLFFLRAVKGIWNSLLLGIIIIFCFGFLGNSLVMGFIKILCICFK